MAVCFKLPSKVAEFGLQSHRVCRTNSLKLVSKVAEFGQQAGIDGMAILRQ